MDSDDDADATGSDDGVEEHGGSDDEPEDEEDEDERESESESESENWFSEEENESEGSSGDESVDTKNLIRRLKANDETLTHVCIRSDVLHQVCAAVQENSNISDFSICGYSGVVIDLHAASAIITALARMPRLSRFSIAGCNNIDFQVVSILATFLSDKGSIRSIRWCKCNLGDREAQAIAACFSGNTEIQEIILAFNNIGNDGAIAIASLIENNDSITSLNLNENKIGAEGVQKLAQAIVQNQRLDELRLYGNGQACAYAAANAFNTALYNDESIETVISGSNHAIKRICYRYDANPLIDLHRDGPEKARRTKIIRFLNEQPTSLFSANLDLTLMPPVLHKVGRDCLLNTMFELVRNMPDLLWNNRTRPNHQCRKRSRLS